MLITAQFVHNLKIHFRPIFIFYDIIAKTNLLKDPLHNHQYFLLLVTMLE